MPELPEVETVVRMLRPHLVGRTFVSIELLWPAVIDQPDPATFCAQLSGATIVTVGRRSKFIVLSLNTGWTLLAHLRMTGKFLVNPTPEISEGRHVRARFGFDDESRLIFSDQRKFGRLYLVADPQTVLGKLGPEPLEVSFTPTELSRLLVGRRGEIKRLLLDQEVIAGLGNIYASEALWRARIHPQRQAGTLTPVEIERLHAGIVAVLQEGVADGGTSLQDRQYVYPNGGLGGHQLQLAVYERAGQACPRCGGLVVRTVLGQRSTYFCPHCQITPSVDRP